jgi:hypothetical protein
LTLDTILTELKAERDRLSRALAALEGTARAHNGRRKAKNGRRRGRPRMSAAARKRLSEFKKRWWAERKKQKAG